MKDLSVREAYKKAFANVIKNSVFSSNEIVAMVSQFYKKSIKSILPRDHCYNSWNKDLDSMEWMPLFEFLYENHADKKFKYLGEKAQYNGKVRYSPKVGNPVYIGEWNNGVFKKYDIAKELDENTMFNKDLLEKYVTEYKKNIAEWRFGENREIYKWEAVEHFQKNWNIDAVDFAEMLKVALDKTENLLTVGLFFPKNMLIGLASKEPETVRSMFRNLFDETLDLNKRVSDFMKQSDELHKRNPGGKSHYQGTRAISVYLWLMYPDKYYIYQYAIYDTNVKALEAEYLIKANGKPETMIEGFRFYDAVRDELAKDTELVRLNNKHSLENYKDENLNTLTIDVGFFIYKKNEDNVTWFPSIKEYNPEITVEEWKELYNDNEVFDSDSKQLMNEMMLMDGKATCSQLAETFLGDKSKFTIYNNKFINLGRSIQQKTGKDLFVPKNEDGKNYWSILCVCKKVDKKSDKDIVGQYIFKLRDGLQEALQEMGLPFENVVNNGVKEEQNIMVKYPKNLILYGPPGTGKTYNSVNYAVAIVENKTVDEIKKEDRKAILDRFKQYKENGLVEFCTFHQSFGYEEFIEGIKPVVENGNVTYKVVAGVFKEFCKEETTNVPVNKVFIIDEINRGNISKIFGELITLIEYSKRIGAEEEMRTRLPYSGEKFGVPNNVYLLGTMNTADRSITLIDTALRRRFKFVEMQPNTELVDVKVAGVKVKEMLEMMNRRIEVLYDREHTIGHSFFMGLSNESTIEDLAEVFDCNVIPLLKEYFYDDYERIAAVLGDNLIENNEATNFIIKQENDYAKILNSDITVMTAYKFNREALENPDAYKKIYE